MRSLEARAGPHRYQVLIGSGLLRQAGPLVKPLFPRSRCAVISDQTVMPLFGEKIFSTLQSEGFKPVSFTVSAGEKAKSLKEAERLCEQLAAAGLDRQSFLLSLGGGVIGDIVGFVASIYLRGIPFVSLPTTLLAQIDSCVGGKTAVNLAAGKNLIGSFHHPNLVLIDTDTVLTLPERIWREGLAEAVKHGVIGDRELFQSIPTMTRPGVEEFIERNLALKLAIVARDERERTGVRSLLNFGHTIGHAIEQAGGYESILHGEAVSLGMVAAARISTRRAELSAGECEKIIDLLEGIQLPTSLPAGISRERILSALPHDKKFEQGRVRFVVAHEIGRAAISEEVTMEDLRTAVMEL